MEWLRYNWFKFVGIAGIIFLALWFNKKPGESIFSGFPPLANVLGVSTLGGGSDGVSELMQSTQAAPPKYALRVLFIGNSYTFTHNIPKQLVNIASSDDGNVIQFTVQSVTRGGKSLKDLWAEGKAARILQNAKWDYVVLQDQSFWAMSAESIRETTDYVTRFDKLAKAAGAKTMIYLIWPRRPGSNWYKDPKYTSLRSADYMLSRFITETYKLSGALGAYPVGVGIYWSRVMKQYPEIPLYAEDAHHPSVAGAYLSALVFYKTLTGSDLSKVTFIPLGVSTDTAAKMKSVVAKPLSGS